VPESFGPPKTTPLPVLFFGLQNFAISCSFREEREREKLSRYHVTETHQENAIDGEQAIFKAKEYRKNGRLKTAKQMFIPDPPSHNQKNKM
jgi:hypothetical protein